MNSIAMGEVHVCKKYIVEYGGSEGFTNNTWKLYGLLDALGGEPNCNNCECNECLDYFECSVSDYNDAIENLKVYIEKPKLLAESERIRNLLKDANYTAEELLELMQQYKSEADTHDGYLHFIEI